MKKIIQTSKIVFLISFLLLLNHSFSQNINKYSSSFKPAFREASGISFIDKDKGSSSAKPVVMHKTFSKSKTSVELKKTYIGSSANIYTLVVPASTCLTACQKTNTIMFTHRGNPLKGFGSSSGNIFSSFSTDLGSSWSHINVTGSQPKANRYPSGVIYNGSKNTTPKNSYALVVGPTTDNTNWTENYFASAKLDSTGFSYRFAPVSTYHENFPRYGLSSCDDGKVHVLGYSYIDEVLDSLIWHGGVVNNGAFDSVSKRFDWTTVKINQKFYKDVNGHYFSNFNTAWSQDGKTGYVYFIGVDSTDNYLSFMPIVYKSIDGGDTWNKMPDYDFSQLEDITSKIWRARLSDNTNPHKILPFFRSENDAVVDFEGNLHIFGMVQGSFYDHIDSIGSIYTYEPQKLFDVYTTSAGWAAELIDTIHSQAVSPAESGFGLGTTATGWNHRIQASRTDDGKVLFVVWTDTDTASTMTKANFYPDILAYGKNVSSGLRTAVRNFTAGTSFSGNNFWNYVSDIALWDNADSKYILPVTTSQITINNDPEDSVAHYYFSGIQFRKSEFVASPGVNDKSNADNFLVSQNYPNPFSGISYVSVKLPNTAEVGLVVRNLLGQIVFTIPSHKVSAGEALLKINAQNLKPGIYLYTVNINRALVSRKMIIK